LAVHRGFRRMKTGAPNTRATVSLAHWPNSRDASHVGRILCRSERPASEFGRRNFCRNRRNSPHPTDLAGPVSQWGRETVPKRLPQSPINSPRIRLARVCQRASSINDRRR
jgi:hypothetical protein